MSNEDIRTDRLYVYNHESNTIIKVQNVLSNLLSTTGTISILFFVVLLTNLYTILNNHFLSLSNNFILIHNTIIQTIQKFVHFLTQQTSSQRNKIARLPKKNLLKFRFI